MITDPEADKERALKDDRIAELEAQLAKLQGTPHQAAPLYQGELPQYKLIKPFWAPGDVYLDPDAGDEVIEWTGCPNESMEPLNEPAKKRMKAFLEGQPGGKTPSLDLISMAAAMVQSKYGASAKDLPLTVMGEETMKMAKQLQAQRDGKPIEDHEVRLPHKEREIPVMGNDPKARGRQGRTNLIKTVPQAAAKRGPAKITGGLTESSVF